MPNYGLTEADTFKYGAGDVDKIYLGVDEVWSAVQEPETFEEISFVGEINFKPYAYVGWGTSKYYAFGDISTRGPVHVNLPSLGLLGHTIISLTQSDATNFASSTILNNNMGFSMTHTSFSSTATITNKYELITQPGGVNYTDQGTLNVILSTSSPYCVVRLNGNIIKTFTDSNVNTWFIINPNDIGIPGQNFYGITPIGGWSRDESTFLHSLGRLYFKGKNTVTNRSYNLYTTDI